MDEFSASHDIVCGDRRKVQTGDVKWLCIKSIQDKLTRPHSYDLGKTCYGDSTDFCFNLCTNIVGDIYLLHILVTSYIKSEFSFGISVRTDLTVNNKTKRSYLSPSLKTFDFENMLELQSTYVTTYQFNDYEVNSLLTDTVLYISVSFTDTLPEILTSVIANHNFSNLLTDPFNSDFIIESSDGIKFNVHKSILSAHSEMFRAMFQQPDSVENQSGCVKLTDETAEDIKYLLEFIYTGTISDSNIDTCDSSSLLILSDKYIVKGLKDLTEHIIIKRLSFDNALDTLELAGICNADLAKASAECFVKKYSLGPVF